MPLLARQFVIGRDDVSAEERTFVLTNLLLQNFSADLSPVAVVLSDQNVTVTLIPDTDYALRVKHLRAYRGTDVTAVLRLRAQQAGSGLIPLASDICLILSVLTGHKVNWVARQAGSTLVFENRVTKPGSGWPVLGRLDAALGKGWRWQDLLNHACNALPCFQQRATTYRFREGLIDSWIDARITTDFLEDSGS